MTALAPQATPVEIAGTPVAPRDDLLSAGLLGVALLYATLRYNLFKGVPWQDWPAYTVNKAFAVGSLLIVAAATIRLSKRNSGSARLLAWGGALALAHSLLSFALLSPTYYPRLFEGVKLTALGGLSLTLGVLLIAGVELGARRASAWSAGLRHATLALIAFGTGVHAALPSLSTWFNRATWPGGMPPLTLISFLVGTLALLAWWFRPAPLPSEDLAEC